MTRDMNDNWLRNIKRMPDGNLCWASAKTKRGRDAKRTYRACRCGSDVEASQWLNFTLAQCMCCEGIWDVSGTLWTPGSRYQVAGQRPPRLDPNGTGNNRSGGDMSMGRTVLNYTK